MAENTERDLSKVFLMDDILPDAAGYFEDDPSKIEAVIAEAYIVLDTNVLLLPYGSSVSSLENIVSVYMKLKAEKRIFIPAQVVREFVKNRPNKLVNLYQGVSDKISQIIAPENLAYTILESLPEYNEINDRIKSILEFRKEIKKKAEKVRDTIREWGVNDPVSQAYRPVFTKDVIIEPDVDREVLLKEMLYRYENKLPPGYKDSGKDDKGVGDFIIWKTILNIGQENKKSVIFVTGDEKADWFHGSEKKGFLPRFELMAEFKRISGGANLFIIPLSKLLELKDVESELVVEVKSEEKRINEANNVEAECPNCQNLSEYEIEDFIGASAFPECPGCHKRFHLHRVKDGIKVKPTGGSGDKNSKIKNVSEKSEEWVTCPQCGYINIAYLGIEPFSTAWCSCQICETKFPIHRKRENEVFINENYPQK